MEKVLKEWRKGKVGREEPKGTKRERVVYFIGKNIDPAKGCW